MLKKNTIALIFNICIFLFAVHVFASKGVVEDFTHWRFFASFTGVIVFGFFVIMIIIQRIKILKSSYKNN